ncbi:hypothetical protein MesoLj113c_15730 [Mesorhizobium sp. 113-3-9]|uniref:AfsR/SARP family transcriptional regulator n=1 Tax=Mesorhizobium sp. 113-3-9 TaxID=2744517 RepID=UPI00192784DE|nr:BTAD domain-containing putative transcriptional regulator [Mesorhizobium sp. 113-3-9]BCG85463.1 hypothetical protein MesoLj113c_15730 [Mesorhizobium sp. 113-3-9]
MANIEIGLLGEFSLRVDGMRIALPPQLCQIVALVALSRNRCLSRDEIATEIWGELSDESAKRNMRVCLSHFKKDFLEKNGIPLSEFFIRDGNRIFLHDNVIVDVEVFSRNVLMGTESSNKRELLADAVAVYKGDLLLTWGFEWIYFERHRLNTMYMECLAILFEVALTHDEYHSAINWGNLLLKEDPYDEAVTAKLMKVLHCQGRRVKAIELFRGLSDRLRHDYGIAPSAQVRSQFEAVSTDRSSLS